MSKSKPKSQKILSMLLTLLLFIVAAYFGLDLDGLFDFDVVTEHVSGDWIRVYFTNPRYPDDPADRRSGLGEELATVIRQAQVSVDLVAYELNLVPVADALIQARQDGARVRVVVESDNLDREKNADIVRDLRRAGIPVIEDERSSGLMHNKFVVIDEQWVWTGSWNLTENGAYRNNNNAVLIASPALAENYTVEFEEMFDDAFGPTSPADTPHPLVRITVVEGEGEAAQEREVMVENYFAPEDGVAAYVIDRIAEAQHHIRFMAFVFTNDEIADAMLERAQAGVVIQGVMESRDADRDYSVYSRLRQAGHDVLKDGNPYIMHHKVIIIDDHMVITGSYNFTNNAERSNDENLLIIHDAEVADLFVEEFGRVYEQTRNQEE
jgi:phosphatidylserine/phosphatidylglycerophosphate/cardiolipin synthase-like enzyme